MSKTTKRDKYLAIYAILADAGESELADFVARELELLAKRTAAHRAPTPVQRENVLLKQEICRVLDARPTARATEIAVELGVSVQKVTALLRQLVTDGYVCRVSDGKVTTFTINEANYE